MKRAYLTLRHITEWLGTLFLSAMVVIVFVTVITRYFFKYTAPWAEEVALLLMVWFGFLGIAIGVAERLHLRIDVLTEALPPWFKTFLNRLSRVLVLLVGVFMVWEGWKLVQVTHESTMAGTKLPSSVLYVVIPIAGLLIVLHTLLQALGVETDPAKEGVE
ncbi:MAG: TRAP transporter small permease [Bacillota bacterium]